MAADVEPAKAAPSLVEDILLRKDYSSTFIFGVSVPHTKILSRDD